MRSILSYYKVQKWISSLIRNNKIFVHGVDSLYLNVGCGLNVTKDFVNLDYHWAPGVDVCWDLEKESLPFIDNSFKGIYTEHCLEHLNYSAVPHILKELNRVLKPGGVLRVIVPDGELYLTRYGQILNGEELRLPYQEGYRSAIERINGLFRNHGHQFIFDFVTFKILLEEAGFRQIQKVKYLVGVDSNLLQDTEERRIESLYLEAIK